MVLSCQPKDRSPSSIEHNLRFATLDIGEDSKLILMGLNCESISPECFDIKELGFSYYKKEINFLKPLFLITQKNKQIETVHTFEYGNRKFNLRTKKTMEDEDSFYINLNAEKIKAKIPNRLIDNPNVKRLKKPNSYYKILLYALDFTPLAPISITLNEIRKMTQSRKSYQAFYLMRFIEMIAIENKFPEFEDLLSKDSLLELGGALRIRHKDESLPISSLGVHNRHKKSFFDNYIRFKTETQSVNMQKLVLRANEEGLIVIPYARDLAGLYFDPKKEFRHDLFKKFLLDTKDIKKIEDRYKDIIGEDSQLVPLGLFMMSESHAPTEIIDFINPNSPVKKEIVASILGYAAKMGMTFINKQVLSISMTAGRKIVEIILKKKGFTVFTKRLNSEAELAAIMDMGTVDFDLPSISKEVIIQQLIDYGFEEDELASIKKRLFSKNSEIANKEYQKIISFFQTESTNHRKLSGLSYKNRTINRIFGWERLKKYLSSNRASLNKWFDKRQTKVRTPSSAELKPSIIFLIDGLRPDRFKEKIMQGKLPNLKKLFVDSGIEFNSFTSRSLTLPSWSTILTGVEQDVHGVRSNTPMDKFSGKPNNNYIDARKDLLFPKYIREGRSFRHLKESGVLWLPEYFGNREKSLLNYMPINDGKWPAVDSLFKYFLKNYRKGLFGVMSGSIALDRASAYSVEKLLKKNPGQYNLVTNWYSCVDMFSHHNNYALDYCYEDLDETIGMVIKAAKNDPILKDAYVYLISDHGHIGGFENGRYALDKKQHYIPNTSLNLTRFFAGDFNNYPQFNFVIKTFESPKPNYDLSFLSEYQIQPFSVEYRGKRKNSGPANILIDFSGDRMAQLYFKDSKNNWHSRFNYYQLKHYNNQSLEFNIIDTLLNVKLDNTVVVDRETREKLREKTGNKPVKFIMMQLRDENISSKLNSIIPNLKVVKFERNPVLIKDNEHKTSIIITSKSDNKLIYQYYVIKDFDQLKSGDYKGVISTNPIDDPLNYLGYNSFKTQKKYTEYELLSLLNNHDYPTAIPSLISTLTSPSENRNNVKRASEEADLIVMANNGFNFNSSYLIESDHGGIHRSEVKNTFYMTHIQGLKVDRNKADIFYKNNYFLNKNFLPLVLEFSGMDINDAQWLDTWESKKALIDDIILND